MKLNAPITLIIQTEQYDKQILITNEDVKVFNREVKKVKKKLTPQVCFVCGKGIYLGELTYFKGKYYHKDCFMKRSKRLNII